MGGAIKRLLSAYFLTAQSYALNNPSLWYLDTGFKYRYSCSYLLQLEMYSLYCFGLVFSQEFWRESKVSHLPWAGFHIQGG